MCMMTVCAIGVADEPAECVRRVPRRSTSAKIGLSMPAEN